MAELLFCDDEPHIRRLIEVTLRSTDHTVRIATDGEECLRLIADRRPDALFLDLYMPGLSGVEVLRTLRRRAAYAGLPIVVVSASTERTLVEDVLHEGATAFLAKPFRPQQLLDTVERVLRDAPPLPP